MGLSGAHCSGVHHREGFVHILCLPLAPRQDSDPSQFVRAVGAVLEHLSDRAATLPLRGLLLSLLLSSAARVLQD